ncbi:MAG: transcriptional regulator [Firmicutes bacterium]|nr:transcriptional regulator [Bacillota bacterium]
MGKKGFYDELRHQLESERERLKKIIGDIEEGLKQRLTDSVGELSSIDQHTADLSSETLARSQDIALKDNSLRILEDVEEALRLMESGEYGICQDCGQPIDEGRLRALPWATECMQCKDAPDAKQDRWHRPVEELVIHFDLTEDDTVGFDREDSWQAVARFGTSNSPQDILGADDYEDAYINADEDIGIAEPLEATEDSMLSEPFWEEPL